MSDDFGSLDNGYRSKCHRAPIRIGFKTIKNTKHRIKVWVCTQCGKRDVAIITRDEAMNQPDLEVSYPIDEFSE